MSRLHADWLRGAWADPTAALARDPDPAARPGPHRRLVQALAQRQQGVADLGPADLVCLVRAVALQESLSGWGTALLELPASLAAQVGVTPDHWQAASVTAVEVGGRSPRLRVSAAPWQRCSSSRSMAATSAGASVF